ncbi:5'-methylthioadenosine/adenosylhomocysteine nucleosidase [Eggerthellaceae bacterium zg-1084]|uniref:5'-methylthioadenosine/adenosylhomocysteine nucleosidase n=1 Tax=Berryella wangjianweii TaxID=2734634 RepID=UPI0015544F77|nr:5'-methylthioadenosine/adenosylhomocysteine nucleosidase [Berryella wangjianweii]NPD31349.1 5'-methylthioadenosine/adenosylhomocysteine nucleosidase [Berryella wangjianweii]
MTKVGIIAAMEVEAELLKSSMPSVRTHHHMSTEFCEGRLGPTDVVVVRSGIGKVNAAMCAQVLVSVFGVSHVINTGIAGSLDARIDIGDLVVSVDAVQHDMDATNFGYEPGVVPQMPIGSFFRADEGLRARALAAARACVPAVGVFEGRVLSGDCFVADEEVKHCLVEGFQGLCCEMEGAAIAHACALNRVPFVVVRAISDKADGSASMDYPVFEEQAARHCALVVRHMVEHLSEDAGTPAP